MNDQPQTKYRQRWGAVGGVALGAFALWLGPVATAVFLVAFVVMFVRVQFLRSRLGTSAACAASAPRPTSDRRD